MNKEIRDRDGSKQDTKRNDILTLTRGSLFRRKKGLMRCVVLGVMGWEMRCDLGVVCSFG